MNSNNNNVVVYEGWTSQQIDVIRRTVAKDASNLELQMFLHLAKKYDLDPFAREIWCVNMAGSVKIMTARDGYLKIANSNPHFKGLESDVVYENDNFTKQNDYIKHSYQAVNRGQIIGAYAIVFRDDRIRPSYFFAPMKDYDKKKNCWLQYPHAMIVKVAESMALKRAFPISGLCTVEELTGEQKPNISEADMKKTRINAIWNGYRRFFNSSSEAIEAMKNLVGDKASALWTTQDMQILEQNLANMKEDAEVLPEMEEIAK